MAVFNDMEEAYKELVWLYDEAVEKNFPIGEALYTQSKSFVNTDNLIDARCQVLIQKYKFSTVTHTPLCSNIDEAPFDLIEDCLLIESEINKIKVKMERDSVEKSKMHKLNG